MAKKLTTEEFIQRANEIHNNFYDYSKTKYVNAQTKVIITCLEHGDFEQRAAHHLSGHGCKKCANILTGQSKVSNLEVFIQKANNVHNFKYDYSKAIYKNARTKVEIICPEHGSFWQTPDQHLRGHGCPKCAFEKNSNLKRSSTKKFIEKAREIHGNKYSYDKVTYINNHTKVIITCPIHGDFEQRPSDHLANRGCAKCKNSKGEIFIEQLLTEHNINFITQYKIPINTSINIQGFTEIDFYLPDYNIFMEYNGIQHYIPQEYFGGKLKFNNYQVPRDNYVRNYCKENDIKLIEIDYTYKTKTDILNYLKINASNIFIK